MQRPDPNQTLLCKGRNSALGIYKATVGTACNEGRKRGAFVFQDEGWDRSMKAVLAAGVFRLFACVAALAAAHAAFILIDTNIVLANEAMSEQLRSLNRRDADGVWMPAKSDVVAGFARLCSKEGPVEIFGIADPAANMSVSLARIPQSRFQVFGLVFGQHRQILFQASPKEERFGITEEEWRGKIVSVRVHDGGAFYWSVLYDVESGRFVACDRRPD